MPICSTAVLGFANSVIDGIDASTVSTGANGYVYDVSTPADTEVRLGELQQGANGVYTRVITTSALGRKVWLEDGLVYFRDAENSPAKPWRKAADSSYKAAEVPGLALDSPLIPNAWGESRRSRHSLFGPRVSKPGLMFIIR